MSATAPSLPRRATIAAPGEHSLPPGPRGGTVVNTAQWLLRHEASILRWRARYGDLFTIKTAGFGTTVCVGTPELAKEVFTAPSDVLHSGDLSPSGNVVGRHSLLALDEDAHLQHRRLMLPAFHRERLPFYEEIMAEEARAEYATWPVGEELPTFPRFLHMTLRTIMRAVFPVSPSELEHLMDVTPRGVEYGQRLAPFPFLWHRNWGPWARMSALRAQFDDIVANAVERARSDPQEGARPEILTLLATATYDDGSQMSLQEISDEVLTLVVGGHLSSASTLAWAVERVRRHPDVLDALQREAQNGGSELRKAVITEVQRMRPAIPTPSRYAVKPFAIGGYVLPPKTSVLVPAVLSHVNPDNFADPMAFRPERFLGARPETYSWISFGGGVRRCIGAAFAQRQLDVVLRELLLHGRLAPTTAKPEKWHTHGIAFSPGDGGLARLEQRA